MKKEKLTKAKKKPNDENKGKRNNQMQILQANDPKQNRRKIKYDPGAGVPCGKENLKQTKRSIKFLKTGAILPIVCVKNGKILSKKDQFEKN